MIENKPKTRLFQSKKTLLFVQTYRDMNGQRIEQLENLIYQKE